MTILTMIDTRRIQEFIFSSNKLRDIIAGSWLVQKLTSSSQINEYLNEDANLIFAGGGNALLTFPDMDDAREFAARYSSFLIRETFTLDLVIAHEEYKPGQLINTFLDLQRKTTYAKTRTKQSVPMLGIGVSASGRQSGLPATAISFENPISYAIEKRRSILDSDNIDEYWSQYIPSDWRSLIISGNHCPTIKFPKELDDLGRTKGEISKIGIVHIDGNSIGRRLNAIISNWSREKIEDREVQNRLGKISDGLQSILNTALADIMHAIVSSLHWKEKDERMDLEDPETELGFEVASDPNRVFLPIRPIVAAGDDLTLITDSRVALSVTEIALKSFEKCSVPYLSEEGGITACAGVSIIPSRSPLFRAYERAEELCNIAKYWRRDNDYSHGVIDWHFDQSNSLQRIHDVRAQQYGALIDRYTETYMMTMKPYPLGESRADVGSWLWLSREVLGTEKHGFRGEIWQSHKNKIHKLRDLLSDGRISLESSLNAWKIVDPNIGMPDGMEGGYVEGRSPLIDMIELLDVYIPLRSDDLR